MNAQNDPEFPAVEAYVKSVIGDQPKPATGSQNPGREEIYDEMTSHIKGNKPATGTVSTDFGAYANLKPAVASEWTVERLLDELNHPVVSQEALAWTVKQINAALAAEREKVRALVDALKGLIRVIPNDERLADMVAELDTAEYALTKVEK